MLTRNQNNKLSSDFLIRVNCIELLRLKLESDNCSLMKYIYSIYSFKLLHLFPNFFSLIIYHTLMILYSKKFLISFMIDQYTKICLSKIKFYFCMHQYISFKHENPSLNLCNLRINNYLNLLNLKYIKPYASSHKLTP